MRPSPNAAEEMEQNDRIPGQIILPHTVGSKHDLREREKRGQIPIPPQGWNKTIGVPRQIILSSPGSTKTISRVGQPVSQ